MCVKLRRKMAHYILFYLFLTPQKRTRSSQADSMVEFNRCGQCESNILSWPLFQNLVSWKENKWISVVNHTWSSVCQHRPQKLMWQWTRTPKWGASSSSKLWHPRRPLRPQPHPPCPSPNSSPCRVVPTWPTPIITGMVVSSRGTGVVRGGRNSTTTRTSNIQHIPSSSNSLQVRKAVAIPS